MHTMMYSVSEYVLFYLKFENMGSPDDLRAIGVCDSSIESEMVIQKKVVDALSSMVNEWDVHLRQNKSYAAGVGEGGVITQHFGPLFLAYVPVVNDESVKSLYALMALSLPRILRKMGCMLRYVRGAFVKGYGWLISESGCKTLYGPIMAKAWHTATKLAYSPRIIIEQDIFDIVHDRNSYGLGPDGDWMPLYSMRDYDGQGIFHYLAHDLESPSIKFDTINVVVQEIKNMHRLIRNVMQKLASRCTMHDSSESIRMSLALEMYVRSAAEEWAT